MPGNDMLKNKIVLDEIEKPSFEGKILLCEDNAMNQQVICEHLARVGLKTVVAENGKKGVEMVQNCLLKGEKQFDLIFMDMHMPVMDGVEASAKILELNAGIPIIAMTANVMYDDREIYRKNGIKDCICKPFTSQELWRCLLKYFTPVKHEDTHINTQPQTINLLDADLEFQKILQKFFVKNYQKKYEEIINALETGDIKLAHRLAHTLKGNAGQLGKKNLQQAAADVEKQIKDGKNLVSEEQLKILKNELDIVLNELSPLLEESAAKPEAGKMTPLEPKKARELIEELEPMLRMGSPESRKFLDSLRRIPESGELIQQIDDFDFETAAVTLARLKEKME